MGWNLFEFTNVGIPFAYCVPFHKGVEEVLENTIEDLNMYYAAVALQELNQEFTTFNIDYDLDLEKETREIYLMSDFDVSWEELYKIKDREDYVMLCFAFKQLESGDFTEKIRCKTFGYEVHLVQENNIFVIENKGVLPQPKPNDYEAYSLFIQYLKWYLENLNEAY